MEAHERDISAEKPDDWLHGRTVYGGLSAALCYEVAKLSAA
jgi:hypothetical protein